MSKRADAARPAAPEAADAAAGQLTDEEKEVIAELDTLTLEQLKARLEAVIQEKAGLSGVLEHVRNQYKELETKVKMSHKALTVNKRLPYLVANIGEILEMEEDEEEEELYLGKKTTKNQPVYSAVVKTSDRRTVFRPSIGYLSHKDLKPDDLVGVNRDTYVVYEKLPEDYDSRVKAMEVDEKPKERFSDVGGLDKQITELLEAVVQPVKKKDLYEEVGIQAPKGVILYGPPGTGKTMIARACAAESESCFLKLAGPQLVQMYIGDGARIVRDAFALAKKKAPSIIFIDELDAVGTRRSDNNGSREVQRTMLELLSQLDGFGSSEGVRVIAATNRIDVLDPALLRSGRIDRKVELPPPDVEARMNILEIHSRKMNTMPNVNYEELARSTEDMTGAQLKMVCVEAGMLALRGERTSVTHEDFVEGIARVQAKKKAALNYYA